MRLLVVSNGFPPRGHWGTEFYTLQLVNGLRARGVEVAVLHPERAGNKARFTLERVEQDGLPIYLLHNPGDPGKGFADSYRSNAVEGLFQGVLDEFKPDMVHFTYLLWGLSARLPLVARERNIPSVVTLTDYGLLCHRGQLYDYKLERCFGPHPPEVCARCIREPSRYDGGPLEVFAKRLAVRTLGAVGGMGLVVDASDLREREKVIRESLDAVEHFVAPTRVLEEAFQAYGVAEERLTRLCYAIEVDALERARPAPGGPGTRFGFLGQFTPHKGVRTLLQAIDILRTRLPESVEPWDVRFYGATAGGRHKRFAEVHFTEDRGPRVKLRPAFAPTRAAEIFAKLDAIILPSEWDENAPLTVLQARAAGVPIIGSDVPGIAEVVAEGVHGRLFPVGDALALANAMGAQILEGPSRTGNLEPPVELGEHLDRIEEIYRRVLSTASTRHD